MEEKKESLFVRRKKEIIMTAISLIIVLGVSFAWVRKTTTSSNNNVLLSGKLRLTIMNEDPIIKAGGEDGYAVPMDDAVGLETKPYTFTIKNTGTISASFDLSLTNATSYIEKVQGTDAYGYGVVGNYTRYVYYDSERVPDSKIRFNVREGNDKNTNVYSLDSRTNRVLYTGTIAPGATKTYYLRLWVDIDATAAEVEGKVFAANLKLETTQSGGGASQSAGPINPHIKAVYDYNENGTGRGTNYTGCLGGSEAGCVDIKSTKTGASTYAVGTIIKYEVKDGEERYFNVLHDDGNTLTLQERQNTVSSKQFGTIDYYYGAYSTNINTSSGKALYEIKSATSSWTYVNDQTYSIGDSSSTLGYSECTASGICNTTSYSLSETAKSRMVTMQELSQLNCRDTEFSCMKFVYNYLSGAASYDGGWYAEGTGGSFETDTNYGK